jgi:aspartate 1-decarboxylase
MIKIWFKHWIFEKCIDYIFDRISSNFNKSPINLNNIKKGDRFSAFIVRDEFDSYIAKLNKILYVTKSMYKNVIVIDIYHSNKEKIFMIEWNDVNFFDKNNIEIKEINIVLPAKQAIFCSEIIQIIK